MAETEETYQVAQSTKDAINAAILAMEVSITRAWVDAWDRLGPALRESLETILTRYAEKGTVPRYVLVKDARLRAAIRQVHDTLEHLVQRSGAHAGAHAGQMVQRAADDVEALLRTQLPTESTVPIKHPAPDALDAMVNRIQGTIHDRTWPLAAQHEQLMKDELLRNIAVGDNPRETARRIMDRTAQRFNGGLGRALNISRTEVLDAYREAQKTANDATTDVLKGQRWTATLDARTCPSCLAQHGTMYPPDDIGPLDHQSGRCIFVPVMKSWKELGIDGVDEPDPIFPDRDEWWDTLDDKTKRSILGPSKFEMFQSGQIGWDDLTVRRSTDGWRDSYVVPSSRSLAASVSAQ